MAPSEYIVSGGTYFLTNAKSGTVLDLSGTDGKSIIGWTYHNGKNQHWTVQWTGTGWTFRNGASNLYLGFDGDATIGTKLIGVPQPVTWHIWHDEEHPENYRVFVPGAPVPGLNLDLSEYGNIAPGTPVVLWTKWNGSHQTWKFAKVS